LQKAQARVQNAAKDHHRRVLLLPAPSRYSDTRLLADGIGLSARISRASRDIRRVRRLKRESKAASAAPDCPASPLFGVAEDDIRST